MMPYGAIKCFTTMYYAVLCTTVHYNGKTKDVYNTNIMMYGYTRCHTMMYFKCNPVYRPRSQVKIIETMITHHLHYLHLFSGSIYDPLFCVS